MAAHPMAQVRPAEIRLESMHVAISPEAEQSAMIPLYLHVHDHMSRYAIRSDPQSQCLLNCSHSRVQRG